MTLSATPHHDTTIEALSAIAQNLCNHLLAFQQTIDARPPQERYPTLPELQMLTKMITCLEKIKRMQKAAAPTRILSDFLAFVKKSDKETAQKLPALFAAYTRAAAEKPDNLHPETNTDAEQTTPTAPPPSATPQPERPEGNGFPLPVPDPSLRADDAPPPISFDDYMEYQHIMLELKAVPTAMSRIRGQQRNTNWIQYNLYQWCLPPDKRKFHHNEFRYCREIDHSITKREIGRYLERHGLKPTYR